mmetsp:Transcript_7227/g.18805  ORF Transcript_7227/g.18805 Transcript_7227/m.18805 type:complete len:247 (+) Transcript_7227:386-1126(+)
MTRSAGSSSRRRWDQWARASPSRMRSSGCWRPPARWSACACRARSASLSRWMKRGIRAWWSWCATARRRSSRRSRGWALARRAAPTRRWAMCCAARRPPRWTGAAGRSSQATLAAASGGWCCSARTGRAGRRCRGRCAAGRWRTGRWSWCWSARGPGRPTRTGSARATRSWSCWLPRRRRASRRPSRAPSTRRTASTTPSSPAWLPFCCSSCPGFPEQVGMGICAACGSTAMQGWHGMPAPMNPMI